MIPMPNHVATAQAAYASLIEKVKAILGQLTQDAITPEMALLIAHIGNQEITQAQIMARKYWISTNVHYNIERLKALDFLISRKPQRDGRLRLICLTAKGLALAAALRQRLTQKPAAGSVRQSLSFSREHS